MIDSRQPRRWLEADDEWRDVAHGLQREAQEGPDPSQRARMVAAVSAQIAAAAAEQVEASAKPTSPVPPKVVSRKLLKFGSLIVLTGLVGAFLATRSTHDARPAVPPMKASEVENVIPSPSQPGARFEPEQAASPSPIATPTVQAPLEESKERPATMKLERRARLQETAAAPQGSLPANPAAELALLVRARRILLADPARTLELTQEHARSYPHGAFSEEREVLAIEALVRSGDRTEGAQRARKFEQLFPRSTHLARIRSLASSP